MGINPRVITYEPTTPASATAWSNVELNDGSGSNAVVAANNLEFAQTIRSYMLQRAALETPTLTLEDIRLSFEFRDQLQACFDMAVQNTQLAWEDRGRDEYTRLAEHKIVVTTGYPEAKNAFPASSATGRVTGDVLKTIYRRLIDLNAAKDSGAVKMVKGAPQFIAVMSPELDDVIVSQDYQIREDFRSSERANELLDALGVDRPYKGFYHVIDSKVPRWNFTGGQWVRVPFTIKVATTNGTMDVPNPDYATATHEDTIIFLPTVYTCLVPKPLANPGGNTKFDPLTYQGDWKWLNIPHMTENPDGNWGRFRGVFYAASKPKFPQFGFVIRGLRPNIVTSFIDANGDPVA